MALMRDEHRPAVERGTRSVGRPRRYETPEAMQTVIDRCLLTTDGPTICGPALALGFLSRQSFYDYPRYGPEFDYVLRRARLRVECRYEEILRDPGPAAGVVASPEVRSVSLSLPKVHGRVHPFFVASRNSEPAETVTFVC